MKREQISSLFKCNNVTRDIPTTCTLSVSLSERRPLDAGYSLSSKCDWSGNLILAAHCPFTVHYKCDNITKLLIRNKHFLLFQEHKKMCKWKLF